MMNNHTDEGAHHNGGFNFNHGAVALSLIYVSAQKFVKRTHISLPEHLCEFVPLERGMQQQPVKLCVVFMMFESGKCKAFENRPIVFSFDRGGDNLAGMKGGIATGFVIQDGGVEFLLRGKMAKDHRLRDPRGMGNFPGRRPAKTLMGKETDGHAENLHAPFFARHSGCSRGCWRSVGYIHWLNQ